MLANFVDFFGPEAAKPMESFELDWTDEAWTRGCPVGHPTQGVLRRYGPLLRKPLGRIHWAGTETADVLERLHGRRGALGRGGGARDPRGRVVRVA